MNLNLFGLESLHPLFLTSLKLFLILLMLPLSLLRSSVRSAKVRNLSILPLTSLVRDKTQLESQQLRACHLNLKRRTSAGESNLTITYINGTSNVTSLSKNFTRDHLRSLI